MYALYELFDVYEIKNIIISTTCCSSDKEPWLAVARVDA